MGVNSDGCFLHQQSKKCPYQHQGPCIEFVNGYVATWYVYIVVQFIIIVKQYQTTHNIIVNQEKNQHTGILIVTQNQMKKEKNQHERVKQKKMVSN